MIKRTSVEYSEKYKRGQVKITVDSPHEFRVQIIEQDGKAADILFNEAEFARLAKMLSSVEKADMMQDSVGSNEGR